MATSDEELETEVRVLTGYDEVVIPTSKFQTVISRAKSFIENRRSLDDIDVDWYGNPQAEEALYWSTCFFAKVTTGELDGQEISVGSIDLDSLLAKGDNDLTTWLRNAINASRSLNPTGDFSLRNISRGNDRDYGDGEGGTGGSII